MQTGTDGGKAAIQLDNIMPVGKIGFLKYRGHILAFNHQRQGGYNCGNGRTAEMKLLTSRDL